MIDLPVRPPQYWNASLEVRFEKDYDAWSVNGYDDVNRVITDKTSFSSDYGLSEETRLQSSPALSGLFGADGQRHRDLRAAVAEPFRPATLQRLETDIREIVISLIDEIRGTNDETVDVVEALARPLPAMMMCRLLGLDLSYAEHMRKWVAEMVDKPAHLLPRQQDMCDFFQELIEERRRQPQPGIIEDLLETQRSGYTVDGKPLSDWDLICYVVGLLGSGTDTTSSSIGNCLLFLTEFGWWERLRTEPALIPQAIEEVLRWYPPFPAIRRRAREDMALGGQPVKAGDWVLAWITAANRDPAHFDGPDQFDPHRRPNAHLSMGRGRHFCLGGPLARMELRVLMEEATHRLPSLRRDTSRSLERSYGLLDPILALHMHAK